MHPSKAACTEVIESVSTEVSKALQDDLLRSLHWSLILPNAAYLRDVSWPLHRGLLALEFALPSPGHDWVARVQVVAGEPVHVQVRVAGRAPRGPGPPRGGGGAR